MSSKAARLGHGRRPIVASSAPTPGVTKFDSTSHSGKEYTCALPVASVSLWCALISRDARDFSGPSSNFHCPAQFHGRPRWRQSLRRPEPRPRRQSLSDTTFNGGTGQGTIFRLAHPSGCRCSTRCTTSPTSLMAPNLQARVVIGPDGALYGTTEYGGLEAPACISTPAGRHPIPAVAHMFNLRATISACRGAICQWNETQIYDFEGDQSGFWPGLGESHLRRRRQTSTARPSMAASSGFGPNGVVYKLSRDQTAGWRQTVLYSFTGRDVGSDPVRRHHPGFVRQYLWHRGRRQRDHAIRRHLSAVAVRVGLGGNHALRIPGSHGRGQSLRWAHHGQRRRFLWSHGQRRCARGRHRYQLSQTGGLWQLNVLFPLPGPNIGSYSSLMRDASGAFYGTTFSGGSLGKVRCSRFVIPTGAGVMPRCTTSPVAPMAATYTAAWPSTPTATSSAPPSPAVSTTKECCSKLRSSQPRLEQVRARAVKVSNPTVLAMHHLHSTCALQG